MIEYLVLLGAVLLFFFVCDLVITGIRIWKEGQEPQNRRVDPELLRRIQEERRKATE